MGDNAFQFIAQLQGRGQVQGHEAMRTLGHRPVSGQGP
jgi:hypothetical protein